MYTCCRVHREIANNPRHARQQKTKAFQCSIFHTRFVMPLKRHQLDDYDARDNKRPGLVKSLCSKFKSISLCLKFRSSDQCNPPESSQILGLVVVLEECL